MKRMGRGGVKRDVTSRKLRFGQKRVAAEMKGPRFRALFHLAENPTGALPPAPAAPQVHFSVDR